MLLRRFREQNWHPDLEERRRFAQTLLLGAPVSALVWLLVIRALSGRWIWLLALGVLGIGLSLGLVLRRFPGLARPFFCLWFGMVCVIDTVVTTLSLTFFYFLVVTPIGLIQRLLGRRIIRKGFDREAPTYWQPAEPTRDPLRYFRQF